MRSLAKLREQRLAFLAALDASPALRTYAHLLRDLVDDRPRSVKIAEAIRQRLGGISLRRPVGEVVYAVGVKLERDLPALPLAEVPCEKVIRRHVLERIEDSRNFAPQVPPAAGFTLSNAEAST